MTAPAETMTKLTIRLDTALHKRIRIAGIEHDVSVQTLVTEAIEKHLSTLGA
ncbi:toxin-antitoxin system HicB family antitoxin [Mycolicibacterium brumae]|uniref:toxin-antitoxin system HicB family antitoxin n=1 Tax=Mycolicibacterium brumae TaxID=85968 RepID=UPI000A4D8EFC|nr:toxin-antitoxin system HicB family antitoxin [Mycolicibacterium brumae]MCV7194127.1 toxin-antitoxin system HicB family antitoxin [Mycolicibacterium brumae]UWW07494.1 toxin-antitoxin system HicB family antitoxin [Mycolicibacterium brumae]